MLVDAGCGRVEEGRSGASKVGSGRGYGRFKSRQGRNSEQDGSDSPQERTMTDSVSHVAHEEEWAKVEASLTMSSTTIKEWSSLRIQHNTIRQ